jgi:phosphopantothenoylcysteine decarboxylase/phosphopantothenate--cysteine ligase
MACGEHGPGRMAEPLEIVAAIEKALRSDTAIPLTGSPVPAAVGPGPAGALAGRHVIVTAGPTHEPIDPVRFIANRSSGKQGYAIAAAARRAGARVTLVSGPVALAPPEGVRLVMAETAEAMLAAVEAALPADIAIFAAAVADWRVANPGSVKIKKGDGAAPGLMLVENPDILATIAGDTERRPPVVIGFAAETDDVLRHARAKLARKGCDIIVANDVSAGSGVMGGEENSVHIVSADGVETWPRLAKTQVATALVERAAIMLERRSAGTSGA